MEGSHIMKDFVGQTLSVGDFAVHQEGGRYPGLRKVEVIGFTAKMVKTTKGTVHPEKLVIYQKGET